MSLGQHGKATEFFTVIRTAAAMTLGHDLASKLTAALRPSSVAAKPASASLGNSLIYSSVNMSNLLLWDLNSKLECYSIRGDVA